jgi:hypothetical protein
MEFSNIQDFETLSNLLKQPESEQQNESGAKSQFDNPGQIGSSSQEDKPKAAEKKSDPKDIWDIDEVEGTEYYEDTTDGREQPEYELKTNVRVRSEDVFLGLDFDRSGTEFYVLTIYLPDTQYSDISLDVTDTAVKMFTQKLYVTIVILAPRCIIMFMLTILRFPAFKQTYATLAEACCIRQGQSTVDQGQMRSCVNASNHGYSDLDVTFG